MDNFSNVRVLNPSEIELRSQTTFTTTDGAKTMLLLYKNARCTAQILTEAFGTFGWKREHTVVNGNLYCTISVKNPEGEWISRQDCGVESASDAEKGEASDAFKRAAVNFGIGIELYSAPEIYIPLNSNEYSVGENGKPKCKVKFYVSEITYTPEREIETLRIIDKWGNERFFWDKSENKAHTAPINQVGGIGAYQRAISASTGSEMGKERKISTLTEEELKEFCVNLANEGAEKKEIRKFYDFYLARVETWNGKFDYNYMWRKWRH